MDRQTDRQAGRQAGRQAETETQRQRVTETERESCSSQMKNEQAYTIVLRLVRITTKLKLN